MENTEGEGQEQQWLEEKLGVGDGGQRRQEK